MNEQDHSGGAKNVRTLKSNVDFDLSLPLDYNKAVSALNGNEQLYFSMLSRFENSSLNECLTQLKEGIEGGELDKVYQGYHTLKSASGYIGAGRVHFACYFIQEAQRQKDMRKLMYSYPLLVETCIEFRIYARKFIADLRKEPYTESNSAGEIQIAKGFTMEQDSESGKFYILKEG